MSKPFNIVIHKQAGANPGSEMLQWDRHEIGCMEMCVPHYLAVHPYRGRLRATGAKSVGLEAVLKHIGGVR